MPVPITTHKIRNAIRFQFSSFALMVSSFPPFLYSARRQEPIFTSRILYPFPGRLSWKKSAFQFFFRNPADLWRIARETGREGHRLFQRPEKSRFRLSVLWKRGLLWKNVAHLSVLPDFFSQRLGKIRVLHTGREPSPIVLNKAFFQRPQSLKTPFLFLLGAAALLKIAPFRFMADPSGQGIRYGKRRSTSIPFSPSERIQAQAFWQWLILKYTSGHLGKVRFSLSSVADVLLPEGGYAVLPYQSQGKEAARLSSAASPFLPAFLP